MLHVLGGSRYGSLFDALSRAAKGNEPVFKVQPTTKSPVPGIPPKLIALVEGCLVGNPTLRPTAHDLYEYFEKL
jgi:hypothetical protein